MYNEELRETIKKAKYIKIMDFFNISDKQLREGTYIHQTDQNVWYLYNEGKVIGINLVRQTHEIDYNDFTGNLERDLFVKFISSETRELLLEKKREYNEPLYEEPTIELFNSLENILYSYKLLTVNEFISLVLIGRYNMKEQPKELIIITSSETINIQYKGLVIMVNLETRQSVTRQWVDPDCKRATYDYFIDDKTYDILEEIITSKLTKEKEIK